MFAPRVGERPGLGSPQVDLVADLEALGGGQRRRKGRERAQEERQALHPGVCAVSLPLPSPLAKEHKRAVGWLDSRRGSMRVDVEDSLLSVAGRSSCRGIVVVGGWARNDCCVRGDIDGGRDAFKKGARRRWRPTHAPQFSGLQRGRAPLILFYLSQHTHASAPPPRPLSHLCAIGRWRRRRRSSADEGGGRLNGRAFPPPASFETASAERPP